MTKANRTVVIVVVALLALAGVVYFVFKEAPQLARPPEPVSLVPQTFGSVHDSPGHVAHVGKDKVACRDCHDESDAGFTNLKEKACVTCHAKEVAKTHAGNEAKATTCLTCHAFGKKPAAACLDCHKDAQGKTAAVAVHVSKDAPCTSCHNPHREKVAVQADCATCHKDTAATHGKVLVATDLAKALPGRNVAGVHAAKGTCSDCHAPHARGVDARASCKGCHEAAPAGDKPSGHAACTTCHEAHQLTRASVKPCVTCHQEKRTAITANHAACRTCHEPHATQAAAGSCAGCHKGKATLGAPAIAAHALCASCHKPHQAKASPAATCVTCHATMAVRHGAGRADKCVDCHAVHPGGRGPQLAVAIAGHAALAVPCSSCHKQGKSDSAVHAKGLTCVGCHKPHAFQLGKTTGAFCASCHGAEAKVALASKGHTDCTKCHDDIHAPTRSTACAKCHADEATSAPAGHRACQNCHQPHDGHVKPRATCQSCHVKEAASKHGHVAGACATCHQPHGPAAPKGPSGAAASPACVSCHAQAKLPGLHQLVGALPDGHTTCASCHSSHAPTRADRATCTTCHEKQKSHQPSATQCNGCHVFRRP